MFDFLKQKYSVCAECGVHFEPVTGHESKWGHLCATHRKPVKERDEKKDLVLSWASLNWEKLYDTAKKEMDELQAAYSKAACSSLADMAASQRAAMSNVTKFGLQGLL